MALNFILGHNFQNREQSQWRKLKGAVTVSEEISQLDSNQVQRWICYDITRMIKVGHNQIISSFSIILTTFFSSSGCQGELVVWYLHIQADFI